MIPRPVICTNCPCLNKDDEGLSHRCGLRYVVYAHGKSVLSDGCGLDVIKFEGGEYIPVEIEQRIEIMNTKDEYGMSAFTESELRDLYELICGNNWIGHGITVFPDHDKNNKELYDGCVELEKRGMITRKEIEPGRIHFEKADIK